MDPLSALVLTLFAIGSKAHSRANELNDYGNTLNSDLPDGYKMNPPNHTFYFGNTAQAEKGEQDVYKQKKGKIKNDTALWDTNKRLPDDVESFSDPDLAKKYDQSVLLPGYRQTQKADLEGQQGKKVLQSLPYIMQYYKDIYNTEPPGSTPPPASAAPGAPPPAVQGPAMPGPGQTGVFEDPSTGESTVKTGTHKTGGYEPPDIPKDVYVTPDLVKEFGGQYLRGKEIGVSKQRADTADKAYGLNERKYNEAEPQRAATLDLTRQRTQKVLQDLQLDPQLVRARIHSLMQPKGGGHSSGRAPTKVEIAQSMLRNKEIDLPQFKKFILGGPSGDDLQSLLGGDDGEDSGDTGTLPSPSRGGAPKPAVKAGGKTRNYGGYRVQW